VNFVKNEISKMWILWKMRFQKCEFCENWNVIFLETNVDFGSCVLAEIRNMNEKIVRKYLMKIFCTLKIALELQYLLHYKEIAYHMVTLCNHQVFPHLGSLCRAELLLLLPSLSHIFVLNRFLRESHSPFCYKTIGELFVSF